MAGTRDRIVEAKGYRELGTLLWFRIARVYNRNLRAAADHLRPFALTAAQFDVIAQVGSAEGLAQGDLAKRLLVTPGNVTQIIDRLEDRGLLIRTAVGRTKRIALTPEGRILHDRVVSPQENLQSDQFAVLTDAEKTLLLGLLRKLDRGQRLQKEGLRTVRQNVDMC